MSRAVLLLVMVVSLWPAGGIAVGAVTGAFSDADDGEVTVTTPSTSGPPRETTLHLRLEDGTSWSCPVGTGSKLEPYKQRLGRLELDLRAVRRDLKAKARRLNTMDRLYPGDAPTQAIADEYNGLLAAVKRLANREDRLVAAYNHAVDRHNAILDDDCTEE